jgi:hypothetical protein
MSFVAAVSADNCPVCQESCERNGQAVAHDGFHPIHEICLRNLLQRGLSICPLCRINITQINGVNVQAAPAQANERADLAEQAVEMAVEREAEVPNFIPNIDPVTGQPND